MNKHSKDLQQYLEFLKKDAEQNIVFNNTSNTYMEYVNAVGENSINEYCNNTFSKNGMNMLQYLHDMQSLLTCDALGLLIWGNILQVSRQTQIPDYFKNVGLYELGEDPISNFDEPSQTNDNLGDLTTSPNEGGNYNNTYTQSPLTDEEFRKCLLLKYRGQWCCGTISNLSDILNWTFYWKDYQWRDKYEELPSDYVPPTPLDEIDYPIKFRVLNNEDYILIIESNRTIETPNELYSNLRYKFVFQYCNLFPQVGGNSYRFNWIGWEDPNYLPLPDTDYVVATFPIPTIKQLSDAGLLIKYRYGSDMTSNDIAIIPVSDPTKVMSGTTGYTIFASKNIAKQGGSPLIRQYENYMDACTVNTAMSLALGNEAEWLSNTIYNKRAVVYVFSGLNEYTYYKSMVDNNTSTIQEGMANGNWRFLYRILPNEDYTVIELFNNKNSNIYAILTSNGISFSNYDVNCDTEISAVNIKMGDYGRTSLYPKLAIDSHSVVFYDGNGTEESNILSVYAANGSRAPFYQDIHMQYQIGYRQIIYDQNPRAVLYYLSGGLVIFSGIVMTNSDGLFSFNIPQLKTLTNLTGDNQVPVYCSIIQDSSNPNHNLFAVAELSNNNITITGKSFIMTTGQGINADIAILVIGILANYVGDELAKIRAYKSSFYYDDLPEDKKVELRQYYISLDETKDLTKVTAPEWLKAELEGKELA